MMHEFGHIAGWDDVHRSHCSSTTIMYGVSTSLTSLTQQDICTMNFYYDPACEAGGGADYENHCTPLILSFGGNAPVLSAAEVLFDISASSVPALCGWTKRQSDAFLVLDRNGDGLINDGSELFGNSTPLGPGATGNKAFTGFHALAVFDQPINGGNGDYSISSDDLVFHRLRLWFDADRDGISQQNELVPLTAVSVVRIPLVALAIGQEDRHGNVYWFGGTFEFLRGGKLRSGSLMDVILTTR